MKRFFSILLAVVVLFSAPTAHAMSANQMIAALQAAVVSNGNADVPLLMKVSASHSAGDQLSSVSSITYVGPVVLEGPGSPSVETASVVNILLP